MLLRGGSLMFPPSHKSHAEELLAALNRIHELEQILRERCYLHPMNLQTNVQNIQTMLVPDVVIVIGKDVVFYADTKLEYAIRCQPEDIPAAQDIKQDLESQRQKESLFVCKEHF
jgi:hypothetical protein